MFRVFFSGSMLVFGGYIFCNQLEHVISHLKFNSSPLKSYLPKKGKVVFQSSNPIIFQGLQGGISKKLLYFEWSPPWHVGWRLSGEGCHWEYDGKNGEFENIDFRFPWLSDTSEMGFGHDVPFLNYSDRLPHPSDLCQPDRVRWG